MREKIIVRPAVEADTTEMVKVNVDTLRATFAGFYSADLLLARNYETVEAAWRHHLWDSPEIEEYAFVAENEAKQLVGVLICGPISGDAEYQAEIFALFVLPAYHGQGIGKQLVQCAIEKLLELNIANMLVWVHADNPARGFYEALGGKQVREKVIERDNARMIKIGYSWHHIEQEGTSNERY